ncbi:MAG: precorrin-6A synthase (deacetylating) [Pseudomonadota bacterium]
MIEDLWLIGIGTGALGHITLEGREAIRKARVVLVPKKGEDKENLATLRYQILEAAGFQGKIVDFDYPTRDPSIPYLARVYAWHDAIASRWIDAIDKARVEGPVALLVWGDPSLYDSTIRIANRLTPRPNLRVVPGITAIQALAAAHQIPLNTIGGPIEITTGRRLRNLGWPKGAESVVVMLDGDAAFLDVGPPHCHIWWGAYLGTPYEIIRAGPRESLVDDIRSLRQEARARHGWIMDTCLLRAEP